MKVDSKKLTSFCGFLGPAIIMLESLATAMLYHGKKGGSYSILNHYISKLGEVGVSRLAPVFNTSLFVSGLVLLIFVLGLGLYIHTKLGYQIEEVAGFKLDQEKQVVMVEFKIKEGIKVYEDAIASVKTSGLIGDRYVSLDVGGSGSILRPGRGYYTDRVAP